MALKWEKPSWDTRMCRWCPSPEVLQWASESPKSPRPIAKSSPSRFVLALNFTYHLAPPLCGARIRTRSSATKTKNADNTWNARFNAQLLPPYFFSFILQCLAGRQKRGDHLRWRPAGCCCSGMCQVEFPQSGRGLPLLQSDFRAAWHLWAVCGALCRGHQVRI